VFFSVRSERQLVEQIDYNLLFRWFVGLPLATTLSRVRIVSCVLAPERLLSKARVVTGCKLCPQAGSAAANITIKPLSLLRIRLILPLGKSEGHRLPQSTEIPIK
jgi:Transposase domain (DUF772)